MLLGAAPALAHNPLLGAARSEAPRVAVAGAGEQADAGPGEIGFALSYVDTRYGGNGRPGWVRSGDMDGDGDLDLVAAGGRAIFVYENDGSPDPGRWTRWGAGSDGLAGTHLPGANGGALLDVDCDGDADVVTAEFESTLGWWENPGPPLRDSNWGFHPIASAPTGYYLHDLLVADLDGDGLAEELLENRDSDYWSATILIRWHRPLPGGSWETHTIEPGRDEGPAHGHAGLDVADVDADGDLDLAYSNGWYESSGSPSGLWTWHAVSDVYGISNTVARDLNGDGRLDLVVAAGHHGQGVFWHEQPASQPGSRPWIRHPISSTDGDVTRRWFYTPGSPALHHPESLIVLDVDFDGDLDVATSDLFFGEDPGEPDWSQEVHNVYVYQNGGMLTSPSWTAINIAPGVFPSHLLQPADLNQDGLVDFISEGAGHSVVSYYENAPEPAALLPLCTVAALLLVLAVRRPQRR